MPMSFFSSCSTWRIFGFFGRARVGLVAPDDIWMPPQRLPSVRADSSTTLYTVRFVSEPIGMRVTRERIGSSVYTGSMMSGSTSGAMKKPPSEPTIRSCRSASRPSCRVASGAVALHGVAKFTRSRRASRLPLRPLHDRRRAARRRWRTAGRPRDRRRRGCRRRGAAGLDVAQDPRRRLIDRQAFVDHRVDLSSDAVLLSELADRARALTLGLDRRDRGPAGGRGVPSRCSSLAAGAGHRGIQYCVAAAPSARAEVFVVLGGVIAASRVVGRWARCIRSCRGAVERRAALRTQLRSGSSSRISGVPPRAREAHAAGSRPPPDRIVARRYRTRASGVHSCRRLSRRAS
jgi:hypothetical protein